MQTNTVANITNLISAAPQATKPQESSTPDTSFNQVLSREVSERNNANAKANESRPADNAPAAQPQPQSQAPTSSKAAQDKPVEAKPANQDKSTDDDDTAVAADTAGTTPADMLALVASLNGTPGAAKAKADKKDVHLDGSDKKLTVDPTAAATANAAAAIGAAGVTKTAFSAKTAKSDDTDATTKTKEGKADGLLASTRSTTPAGARVTSEGEQPKGKDATQQASPITTTQDTAAKPAIDVAASAGKSGKAAPEKTDFAAEMKDMVATVQQAPVQMQALPQAALQAVTAAASQVSEHLAPRVGSPGWDNALGQKITWMAAGEQQTASLTLNPPDLGPLQIVLSVNNSQADATFTAAQPEVRQALEAAMPKLRDMLSDAGIQLGQATVNSGSQNQQMAQDQRQHQSNASRSGGGMGGNTDTSLDNAVRTARVQPSSTSGRGLVDTFV